MRQIVLDTETTGLDPSKGDRIVEIGCIELWNYIPTGRHYHAYINPERPMHPDSIKITGIKDEFLQDKPVFHTIAEEFFDFLQDSPLVIHNAPFDMKFINAERKRLSLPAIGMSRAIDTLIIARNQFPGSPASLNALCRRFNIDISDRDLHGALLDAQLLAKVYLELMGGRQTSFSFSNMNSDGTTNNSLSITRASFDKRSFHLSKEDEEKHLAFLKKISNSLWHTYNDIPSE